MKITNGADKAVPSVTSEETKTPPKCGNATNDNSSLCGSYVSNASAGEGGQGGAGHAEVTRPAVETEAATGEEREGKEDDRVERAAALLKDFQINQINYNEVNNDSLVSW